MNQHGRKIRASLKFLIYVTTSSNWKNELLCMQSHFWTDRENLGIFSHNKGTGSISNEVAANYVIHFDPAIRVKSWAVNVTGEVKYISL